MVSRSGWSTSAAAAGLLLLAVWLSSSCSADREPVTFPEAASLAAVGSAIEWSVSQAEVEVVLATRLDIDTVDSLAGYLSMAGVADEAGGWELDLTGLERPAERSSMALLEIGVTFERSGPDGTILSGPDPLADVVALVDRARSEDGRQPNEVVERVARRELGDLVDSPHGADVAAVPTSAPVIIGGSADDWLAATTGSPVPGAPLEPPSADGGVSWNNREAQAYVPERVTFATGVASEWLTLTAHTRSLPDTQQLPFESGMALSRDTFTWGTWAFELRLPTEPGLWPAVWLLGTEACSSPGRCEGYETSDYLELDIVESTTEEPDLLHTSAHWYDERIRSLTAATAVADPVEPMVVTFRFERRPGLLRWTVDGETVFSVAGPAHNDRGPHRPGPMRLVVNLAVGGSFAGDRILGPTSAWWGDARVPAGFPDHGWADAEMSIGPVTFTPLISD